VTPPSVKPTPETVPLVDHENVSRSFLPHAKTPVNTSGSISPLDALVVVFAGNHNSNTVFSISGQLGPGITSAPEVEGPRASSADFPDILPERARAAIVNTKPLLPICRTVAVVMSDKSIHPPKENTRMASITVIETLSPAEQSGG
jgi:hypothetical protein